MTVKDIKWAIAQLPQSELVELGEWFEEYLAEAWDKQIELDLKAGRLDAILRHAEEEYDAGRCKPL